jgi:hypothetical protein
MDIKKWQLMMQAKNTLEISCFSFQETAVCYPEVELDRGSPIVTSFGLFRKKGAF